MAIKIGLMGCGTVATYGHLPTLRDSSHFELHAIFEPDAERREATQRQFAVPHASDDIEAFMSSGIEAVTITSPAPFHRQNLLDAARHGLPVLCEKPLALREDDAQAMVDAAESAGIALYTAFDYRFSPVALRIHELVGAGAIGEVRSLRLIYNWNCHGKMITTADGQQISSPRRDGRMEEGGPMIDCGTHQIDLARWWLRSEVVGHTAAGAWVDEYEAPDHVWLHLDHASGAHTMVEISYSYCHTIGDVRREFVYELIGSEGLIRYDREAKTFQVHSKQGIEALPYAPEKNFGGMYNAFAEALQTGDPGHLATGQDGLAVARLASEGTQTAIRRRKP